MREPRKKARLAVSDPKVREHLLDFLVCFYCRPSRRYKEQFAIASETFDRYLFDLMLVQFSGR